MRTHSAAMVICVLLMVGVVLWSAADDGAESFDVTEHVETLGNPYQSKCPEGPCVYARNIWDLCAYDGELLIGAGNSSNSGPSPNAGPVPVISYSPSSGQFKTVFTVDDEQIDIFRILDGKAYVPGHDPKESWELGNFYRLEGDGVWHKYRNIPNGIHNYDMAFFGGVLFAGLGTQKGAAVAMSRDFGDSWTEVLIPNSRIYAFIVFKDALYAAGVIPCEYLLDAFKKKGLNATMGFYQYDFKSGFKTRDDLTPSRVFPGVVLKTNTYTRVVHPVSFKGKVAYIGAYCHNDHQFMPFGAYVADTLEEGKVSVRQIQLPQDSRAWDILFDKDTLYVLVDSPDSTGTSVRVLASNDGLQWTDIMRFHSKTFARSFALLDGEFYFGLGCEVSDPAKWTMQELPDETGHILRVKKGFWDHADSGTGI